MTELCARTTMSINLVTCLWESDLRICISLCRLSKSLALSLSRLTVLIAADFPAQGLALSSYVKIVSLYFMDALVHGGKATLPKMTDYKVWEGLLAIRLLESSRSSTARARAGSPPQ